MLGRTFAGAWIETTLRHTSHNGRVVAPLRVRGLKLQIGYDPYKSSGRTFAGAWIETSLICASRGGSRSRTFAGAWIETINKPHAGWSMMSHLCGCVD